MTSAQLCKSLLECCH